MIPNKNIFCNNPWFELHMYWDGSFGSCCAEYHKLYSIENSEKYNIKNMSIRQWFDSEPMRDFRLNILGNKKISSCRSCYLQEDNSNTSRRHKCNSKSAIFTKQNFNDSYSQSLHRPIFDNTVKNNGVLDSYPIDLHIDLGNFCNLSCKMCNPLASSKIASQFIKWGMPLEKSNKTNKNFSNKTLIDWTKDEAVWNRTCEEISSFNNLQIVHFMGGEPMLAKRFIDFCDYMIEKNKTNFMLGFVTNGTIINHELIERLKKFKSAYIELSIETLTEHNDYIRQGSNIENIKKNILTLKKICDEQSWNLNIRPAISILSIGYYDTLLKFCLDEKLLIKSNIVETPVYLDTKNLPTLIADEYISKYESFIENNNLKSTYHENDYNEGDKHEYKKVIKSEAEMCINLLKSKKFSDREKNLKDMIGWCNKWDHEQNLDGSSLYPEFKEIFQKYEH